MLALLIILYFTIVGILFYKLFIFSPPRQDLVKEPIVEPVQELVKELKQEPLVSKVINKEARI